MVRSLLIIIIFLNVTLSFSQELRVGLLRTVKIRSAQFTSQKGSYTLLLDSLEIGIIEEGAFLSVELNGSKVSMHHDRLGNFIGDTIRLISNEDAAYMQLRSITPGSKTHHYRDNFEISSSSNRLQVINLVDMNNYLDGVIYSEGGGGRHLEYYKVQALMCRTYAMQNFRRHQKEGFSVCDGVHCQAYHNMLKKEGPISEAVRSTSGEVIVDKNNKTLTTYFHANCGGQTCDASYVWNTSVPYCETFIDTFCTKTWQATWTKKIEASKWFAFLKKEYGFPIEDPVMRKLASQFKQDQRMAFFIHPSLGIPLRDLRNEFRLKSTFFNVSLEGNMIVLEGRGFGHGVGLCQEGAMEMAKAGYSYRQIAHYYFNDVKIVDLDELNEFNEESDFQ